MMDFLIYDAKVAVALLVFYLFYRFLLKRETLHRLNRVVLVGTAVLSFLLPLCIITIHRPMETTLAASEPMIVSELPEMQLEPIVAGTEPWRPVVLGILFWAGVAFVLLRVLISILSILRIIRQGEQVVEEDGCRIVVTDRDIDPFSWMKYLVLSRKDWELPHDSILAHEKAHIAYGHSMEVLLVDILSALQWFNPAIWMLRTDLKELHEYEADDAVLRTGANIKEYQYLLIRKAVSKSGYSVANSFNHSILKNRITMMSKSKSPLARGLRVLFLLPLVCLAIGLQARTVYVPADKDSEKIVSAETSSHVLPKVTVVKYAPAQVTPEDIIHVSDLENFKATGDNSFDTAPVCSENFAFWLNSRLKYPADCLYEGTILAMFEVGTDGKVGNVKIAVGVCEELNEAVAKLIGKSPVWTPAQKDGQPVATTLFQPVIFKIRTSATAAPTVILNIRADGTVEYNGKVMTTGQLKDHIVPPLTIRVQAKSDVPMGTIDDVRQALRGIEGLKVRYLRPSDQEEDIPYMFPVPNVPMSAQIDAKKTCLAFLNGNDRILFGDRPIQEDAEIVQYGKAFLKKNDNHAHFVLRCYRSTSYGAYLHLQTLIMKIYEETRDEKALEVYGKRLNELSLEQRNQINFMVPFSIAEAEMKE
ncbi:MAG: energy transducer TonB [Bacteroidales bacterium]|nr:energy transducer TonB [Bacteroidales bacterium]